MYASSCALYRVLSATATAPIIAQACWTKSQAGRLGSHRATLSSFAMPSARSPRATRSLSRRSSAYVMRRSAATMASRSGKWAATWASIRPAVASRKGLGPAFGRMGPMLSLGVVTQLTYTAVPPILARTNRQVPGRR